MKIYTLIPIKENDEVSKSIRIMKERRTIVIDTEENDDWMKELPGYADEIRLHEELANNLKANGQE